MTNAVKHDMTNKLGWVLWALVAIAAGGCTDSRGNDHTELIEFSRRSEIRGTETLVIYNDGRTIQTLDFFLDPPVTTETTVSNDILEEIELKLEAAELETLEPNYGNRGQADGSVFVITTRDGSTTREVMGEYHVDYPQKLKPLVETLDELADQLFGPTR